MAARSMFKGLVLAFVLACASLPVTAAQSDAEGHTEQPSSGGTDAVAAERGASQGHSGGDEFEGVLHANAGPEQSSFSEIRGSLALWTLVVFGLLLTILWKFAWGPISEALDRREAGILANIAAAKQQNETAAKLLADHQAQLAGTADEVRRILDDARRDADTQKQQILAEAQAAAQSEKQRAVQEIEAAKNGALQELAEKSVDTAVGLAGKIVQRQLSPADHASLISEALEHFPSKS